MTAALPPQTVALAASYEPPNGTVNTAQVRYVLEALAGIPTSDPLAVAAALGGVAYVESLIEQAIEAGTLNREEVLGAAVLCKIAGNHLRCVLTDIGAITAPHNPQEN